MRRDKSFADDLVVQPGRVSSRVALLLRAAERKPAASLVEYRKISPSFMHQEPGYCKRGGRRQADFSRKLPVAPTFLCFLFLCFSCLFLVRELFFPSQLALFPRCFSLRFFS